ncbi:MAG: histidinol-phosphate aminotransferase family protein [Spirochaetaceae bacterium]|nr:histidinol-phosphate aminotransferase family protein [Spirochaetaceae bacterium]
MQQSEYKSLHEKFDFISSQHGGYYRHNFIDHAYLYNLYFPPEEVFTKFKDRIHDLVLNYPVAQNDLAGLIGNIINQPPERIVVGNGAAELIKIVSGHIASKLIIPVPSFNEYANAAPSSKVVEFPLDFPSFKLDVDKFAAEAIKVNADVAVVVTPNNPTSMLVQKSDLVRLSKKLEPSGCMLIIDESFLDFSENPEQTSLEKEIADYPNMAILKSMSKAYGICGLRIGYMLTSNRKFAEAVRKGVHIWNINGFAEEFLRLLPEYKEEFADSCKQVRLDRDSMYLKMKSIRGMIVYNPDANYIFCRLPDHVKSAPEIVRDLFIKHNMYVKDCVGKTQPDSDRYLRIACRTEKENNQLIKALIDVMNIKEENKN